jgi:tetratricopeptide (TPR) repeat protein
MLLGSILQEQPHYIMTSQLVDVKNGKIIASQRITGESGEKIFSLVDRLTNEIKGDLALPAAAKGEEDTPVAEVTTHSTEAYRHYLEGMDYVNKYYAKEAKASFEKALAYDSTLAMAHWALALNSVPTSKSEKRKAIVRAVRHSDKVSKRGREYIQYTQARLEGDYDGAVKILNQLIAENPKDKEAYKELGNIYMNVRHDSERAIASYRKAIEIDPLDKASYNVLAYEYQNRGDIDNYIWAIYQYMTLAPDEANPFDSRADLYAFSGKIDKAIESYTEALKRKPDYYPSLRKIGFMHLFKMDYEGAKAHFQKFLASSDPDARSEGRLYLAFIPMFQGRLEAALDILDQGILGDQAEGYRGFAHVRKFFHKSVIFSEKNEFDQAIAEAKRMMELQQKLESEDPPDRGLLIYVLARKNDFSKAERQLAELRAHHERTSKTGMADYWGVKGWVELLKGNPDSACTAFEKAAENVNYFSRRYPLALAYLKAGRLVESIHEFEKLLRRYSEDRANGPIWAVELCYHLGVAYEESGRYDRAIEKYEEFLSIWKDASPELDEVGDARERLARLKAAG